MKAKGFYANRLISILMAFVLLFIAIDADSIAYADELHTHTDACYDQVDNLICGLEESADYASSDAVVAQAEESESTNAGEDSTDEDNGSEADLMLLSTTDNSAVADSDDSDSTDSDVADDEDNVTVHKQIDYLGDGGENEDTTLTGDDKYRLYLDLVGSSKPVDVLFVVDRTTSMQEDFAGNKGTDNISKEKYVNQIMNDAEDGTLGFLNRVALANSENNIALILFGGPYNNAKFSDVDLTEYPKVALEWTNAESPLDDIDYYSKEISGQINTSGTNYATALIKAMELLGQVEDDGNPKIVIFITDGEPNQYVDLDAETFYQGDDSEEHRNNMISQIKDYSEQIQSAVNDVYALGIINTGKDRQYQQLYNIAGSDDHVYYAGTEDSLYSTLEGFLKTMVPSNVVLEDSLSRFVELYEDQIDLKVTRESVVTGNVETIWSGNSISEDGIIGQVVDGFEKIIESVKFVESTTADSNGKIVVTFVPEYAVDSEYVFTLSYNVVVSDEAKNSDEYPHVGDEDTDYGDNATSSQQPGFFSNAGATVSYKVNDEDYSIEYPYPVVQVKEDDPTPDPTPDPDPTPIPDPVDPTDREEEKTAKEEKVTESVKPADSVPKTGDDVNAGILIALILSSFVTIMGVNAVSTRKSVVGRHARK